MKRAKEIATAYHEAGHAFIVWKLGVSLKKITIVPSKDFAGCCTHAKVVRGKYAAADDSDRTRIRMERLVLIALAGTAAQRLHNSRSYRHFHSQTDHDRAVDVALTICGSSESAEAYLRWLNIRVRDMLRFAPAWRAVRALAKELLKRKVLQGGDAARLIHDEWMKPA